MREKNCYGVQARPADKKTLSLKKQDKFGESSLTSSEGRK